MKDEEKRTRTDDLFLLLFLVLISSDIKNEVVLFFFISAHFIYIYLVAVNNFNTESTTNLFHGFEYLWNIKVE